MSSVRPQPTDPQDEETRRDHEGDISRPRLLAFWEGGTRSCPLPAEGTVAIGRALDCDLVIDHASVSRRHAVLHVERNGLSIEDLGASNSTTVAGVLVGKRANVAVEPGQAIGIGRAIVVVDAIQREEGSAQLGESMRHVEQLASTVAPSHLSVLITGETGAGKEVMAEFIHRASPRASRPFLRLNCAALPENLLESELFGFERGAFTGAATPKPGLLEAADGGTVFLDEIGELAATTQAKLLRVVESREVTRLGSTVARKIDVRFVCATHRDLKELVTSGRFRQDLYYRVNGVELAIPALRNRRSELMSLASMFATETAQRMGVAAPPFQEEVLRTFVQYPWPGNIRELKNVVERAVVLSGGEPISVFHLPPELTRSPSRPPSKLEAEAASIKVDVLREAVKPLERQRIERALEQACGNQTRAAEILGISRRTLLKRLDEYAFPRPRK